MRSTLAVRALFDAVIGLLSTNFAGCDVGSFQDLDTELKARNSVFHISLFCGKKMPGADFAEFRKELPGRYAPENNGCMYVAYPTSSGYVTQAKEPACATKSVKPGLPLDTGEAMGCVAVRA